MIFVKNLYFFYYYNVTKNRGWVDHDKKSCKNCEIRLDYEGNICPCCTRRLKKVKKSIHRFPQPVPLYTIIPITTNPFDIYLNEETMKELARLDNARAFTNE